MNNHIFKQGITAKVCVVCHVQIKNEKKADSYSYLLLTSLFWRLSKQSAVCLHFQNIQLIFAVCLHYKMSAHHSLAAAPAAKSGVVAVSSFSSLGAMEDTTLGSIMILAKPFRRFRQPPRH